jgi:hypothetical protein
MTGANSKAEWRVEQSESSRLTVRSIEITVETDEIIHTERGASFSDDASIDATERSGSLRKLD